MLLWWLADTAFALSTVAVTPFTNAGGPEYEPLSVGLQSMITTDLTQSDDFTVVERARIQDLLGEIELSQSKYIDPQHAVQLGKLLGSTHVVTGSFTVSGATMRIDAQLVEVTTGKAITAYEKTGEKDAFFELEKELVKELLVRMGAVLSPKERADIAKIQTADFGAFQQYSAGLSLYDADRYSEAIAVLEQVARQDPGFTLATVTVAEIRDVQRQVEAKAQAARIAQGEQEFVAHEAAASRDAEWVERLRAIASDPARPFQDRGTANLLLVQLSELNQVFGALKASADRFALERAGERAYQALWADLRPRNPPWFAELRHPEKVMDTDASFEEMLAWNRSKWFETTNHYLVLSSCPDRVAGIGVNEELTMLWLPYVRRLDLLRELYEQHRGCMKNYESAMRDLAQQFIKVGEVGTGTALLDALAKGSKDPRFLDSLVQMLREAQEAQQALDVFPAGSLGFEAQLPTAAWAPGRGSGTFSLSDAQRLQQTPDRIAFRLAYDVRRSFSLRDPIFVNGLPAWIVTEKGVELQTGPRSSVDETRAIRHYRDLRRVESYGQQKAEPPTVVIVGGVPRAGLTAKVTVDYRPAADWWPLQVAEKPAGWAPLPDRPTAGLLFGLREVETQPVCDPVDPAKMEPVPTTGYAAVIEKGALTIAPIRETYPAPDECRMSPNRLRGLALEAPIASKPLTKPTAEITLTVKDRTVTASAGGTTVTATLKTAPSGFVALYADGAGYVELRDPALP